MSTMMRAFPDLGSCAATSEGMDKTAASLNSVVNSIACMAGWYGAGRVRSNCQTAFRFTREVELGAVSLASSDHALHHG